MTAISSSSSTSDAITSTGSKPRRCLQAVTTAHEGVVKSKACRMLGCSATGFDERSVTTAAEDVKHPGKSN
jgi:hypothetical protein